MSILPSYRLSFPLLHKGLTWAAAVLALAGCAGPQAVDSTAPTVTYRFERGQLDQTTARADEYLGLALDLRDRLTGEVTASGLDVRVAGEGTGTVPLDPLLRTLQSGKSPGTAHPRRWKAAI